MSRTMSRIALSLVGAALFSLSLASCGGDLLNVDQNWSLATVNDSTLPYTVPNASQDRVVSSGVAALASDHTYVTTFTGTVGGIAGQVGQDHGSWAISNSTFIFHSAVGPEYIAALTGSTFRGEVPGTLIGSSETNFTMTFTK